MSDTWRLKSSIEWDRDRAQSSSRSLWHERNPLLALVAASFPLVRDHRFTGLPSADIAAFHLSEEGQLLLGSSRHSESVEAEEGMERQWCVMVFRCVEDCWWTVVFTAIVDMPHLWNWTGRGLVVNYFDDQVFIDYVKIWNILNCFSQFYKSVNWISLIWNCQSDKTSD